MRKPSVSIGSYSARLYHHFLQHDVSTDTRRKKLVDWLGQDTRDKTQGTTEKGKRKKGTTSQKKKQGQRKNKIKGEGKGKRTKEQGKHKNTEK